MIKYYDILQIVNIRQAIYRLADELNMERKELEVYLDLDTFSKVLEFVQFCHNRNYSTRRVISRKLNDIAISHNLTIRFIPPQSEIEKEII